MGPKLAEDRLPTRIHDHPATRALGPKLAGEVGPELGGKDTVAELIRVRHGIVLSLRTVGNYLRSWGLSPQKPIRRAYEQNPESVQRWLEADYPAIVARARRERALILWLDQTGIRSDAAVGRTWAPTGQTPVVGKTGKRFSVNAMCAIGNKGELYLLSGVDRRRYASEPLGLESVAVARREHERRLWVVAEVLKQAFSTNGSASDQVTGLYPAAAGRVGDYVAERPVQR